MSLLRVSPRNQSYVLNCMRVLGARRLNHLVTSDDTLSTRPLSRCTRLSDFWLASTGGIQTVANEGAHAKLVRAGYLRQSHVGIFHMLPLGQRVQEKLERLIDKYMLRVGASKVSLSSISSQALWQQTNRLEGYGPELFRLTDRKDVPYLLAPTHEEEITTLVSKTVNSYKSLPLRLYQIGRKYRDEIRPRHGILRSREFIMKDLYTFDYSVQSALASYAEVRDAYSQLFDELKLPYLVAEASSGDIGGDLSHEYHLPTPIGEDNVISCNSCDYVANEELAASRTRPSDAKRNDAEDNVMKSPVAHAWRGVSKDRATLIAVWHPVSFSDADINAYAIKTVMPELDTSLEDPMPFWDSSLSGQRRQVVNIVDYRLGSQFADTLKSESYQFHLLPEHSKLDPRDLTHNYITSSADGGLLNTIRIRDGDDCPRCEAGKLKVQKAIELGHTFHLGTRYSDPLEARVQVPSHLVEEKSTSDKDETLTAVSMQMGCHGIGVSRIIGAVADHLFDDKGLNWPRAIAPFDAVVIPGKGLEKDATALAESLVDTSRPTHNTLQDPSPLDLALDDRAASFPWKMKDADLIGYPVIIILGRKWTSDRLCEVQCRRLGTVRHDVAVEELPVYVNELLGQL